MTEESLSPSPQAAPGEPGAAPSFKRIAIVGTAPSSRPSSPFPEPGCPYDPKDWNVRCIGMDPQKVTPGWHVWYEIHDLMWLMDKYNNPDYSPQNEIHVRWLAQVAAKGAEVRLSHPSPLIPNAKTIARDRIVQEWPGPFAREFRNSSIALMIAEAILEGAEEIGLWGVDMALNAEYAYQRSGVFYFLDQAWKRGIKILLPPQSDLFFGTSEYPECTQTPEYRKHVARRKEIMMRLSQAQQMKTQAQLQEAHSMGALENEDWNIRTFVSKM